MKQPAAMSAVSAGLAVVGLLASTGCGPAREVVLPRVDDVAAPTFVTRPADLADSPHLAAIVTRDTSGLLPDIAPLSVDVLAEAVETVKALEPRPERFTRVSIYEHGVFFTWIDATEPGRATSASYDRETGSLYVGEPAYEEEQGYSLDGIDLSIPAELVDAIERRHPGVAVAGVDLRVGLSYGFGLVWNLAVVDARGALATVYADLDGTIVAVDGA